MQPGPRCWGSPAYPSKRLQGREPAEAGGTRRRVPQGWNLHAGGCSAGAATGGFGSPPGRDQQGVSLSKGLQSQSLTSVSRPRDQAHQLPAEAPAAGDRTLTAWTVGDICCKLSSSLSRSPWPLLSEHILPVAIWTEWVFKKNYLK